MKLTPEQLQQFDRDGYLFFPSLFTATEVKALTDEVPGAVRAAPPREHPREGRRRRAHELRRAHVQPCVRAPRPPPANGRAGEAAVRRGRVHAPVQDQRQGRVRRRPVAVAPGLRHLAGGRPDARGARDEHRDLPERGERVQRAAHVHPRAATSSASSTPRTTPDDDELSAVGASTTTPFASWCERAGSSRRRGQPGR